MPDTLTILQPAIPEEEGPQNGCRSEDEARLFAILRILAAEEEKKQRFREIEVIETSEKLRELLRTDQQLRGRRILFAVCVGTTGINLCLYRMLDLICREERCMEGSVGVIIVDAGSELYTKSVAHHIAFIMNMSGCLLPGKPLVEGTGSLRNFEVTARNLGISRSEAYERMCSALVDKLYDRRGGAALQVKDSESGGAVSAKKKLLAVHASSRKTSNTLRLWEMVRASLGDAFSIREIPMQNGEIKDCIGCHFNTCSYFGRQSSCYFGGTIVEEIYPAIEACDALIMLCPNYNDALGANLTAMINRLTALFRKMPFDSKYLFALIVSGYSGGDLVARQLIGALNMNKAFILPPRFAMMEIANEPNSILRSEGIEGRAESFAGLIADTLSKPIIRRSPE